LPKIASKSIDAVIFDPPWGINYDHDQQRERSTDPDAYWAWFQPIYKQTMRVLVPEACGPAGSRTFTSRISGKVRHRHSDLRRLQGRGSPNEMEVSTPVPGPWTCWKRSSATTRYRTR